MTTPNRTERPRPQVLVFAGSRFAKPLLAYLANEKCLAGVILPAPEASEPYAPEVAALAHELQQAGIRWQTIQREHLSSAALAEYQADCALCATFPFILPTELIAQFNSASQKGIYNLHASALPHYSGPQPLYWQLRDRQTTSAMVLHALTPQVDGGNIVIHRELAIHPLDTLASLHQRQSYEAQQATGQWLQAISQSDSPLIGTPQTAKPCHTKGQRYAQRPECNDCRINFARDTAEHISAMCRAGNGGPFTAIATIKGLDVQLLQATPVNRPSFGVASGTVLHVGEPEGLIICAKASAIRLDIIASPDGVFTGQTFAERFELDAGSSLAPSPKTFTPQPA